METSATKTMSAYSSNNPGLPLLSESASLGCNSTTQLDCFGDGTMCLEMERVCDGANDCGGWQDEPKGRKKTRHE